MNKCEHMDVESFGSGVGLSFCYCHDCKTEVSYQQALKSWEHKAMEAKPETADNLDSHA